MTFAVEIIARTIFPLIILCFSSFLFTQIWWWFSKQKRYEWYYDCFNSM